MSRIRGRSVLVVALAISLVLCATAGAAPVRRGATYEGRGRQPQFPLSPGGPDGSFIIQFRATRDGRRVTELHVWGLPAACTRPARSYIDPSPAVGSARIRSGGTFRADLNATISGIAGSKVIVTGRFLSHGGARGTLDYRGPRGPQRGCTADGSWAARVKPPPPPVQHFTGPRLREPASRSSARANDTRTSSVSTSVRFAPAAATPLSSKQAS